MGWLNEVWARRMAITLDNGNGGAVATADADVVIPKGFDDFWTRIDASGLELRVTYPDGQTIVPYSVDNGSGGAFSLTNKLGRLRLDGVQMRAAVDGVQLMWLYYGSTSAQGTGAVATAIVGPTTGYIELGLPNLRHYPYDPPRPGYTRPMPFTSMSSGEVVDVWVDVTKALEMRNGRGNGSTAYEEAGYLEMHVYNSVKVDQPTMYSSSNPRFVYHQRSGRTYVKLYVVGGVSGQNYNIAPNLYTAFADDSPAWTRSQKLQPNIALYVRDLVAP
jgi:hypothetical protein